MNLTLHIGHFKTGSSAIQAHFDANRRAYREQGLLYPVNGRPTPKKPNHSGIALQMLAEVGSEVDWYQKTKSYRRYRAGKKRPERAKLLDELERKAPERVFLSSEAFIRFGGRGGVPASMTKEFVDSLSPSRLAVICYLRRPDRYLESWYNQLIKLGRSPRRLSEDLDRYLDSVHVQYFDAVSYWTNALGADHLSLLSYDDVGSSLIETTVNEIGAPQLTKFAKGQTKTLVNPRIPNAFIEFVRVHNHGNRRSEAIRLAEVLSRAARTPEVAATPVYSLDLAARRRLLEVFRPIDRQLAALAGTGDTFFPDLEDMMSLASDSISDQEAFARWGLLGLETLRDDLEEALARPKARGRRGRR